MGTIKPNAGQINMTNRLYLCEKIMDFIYKKQNKILNDRITDLALENQILLNASSPTFMFQNKWYPTSFTYKTLTQPANIILDPSLYKTMDKLINKQNWEQKIERIRIKHCISQFVMESSTVTDLYNLFPEQIISYIDSNNIIKDLENAPNPLSSEEINKIKKQNSQALLALNKLFITRLLLNDI